MIYRDDSKKSAVCPYCLEIHIIYDNTEDINITIVCEKCHGHYSINLLTLKTTKKRSSFSKNANDEDMQLIHKLKCPYCGKYAVLNQTPVDTIISVKCPNDNRYFRANLLTGRTWCTAAQPNNK